MSKCADTEEKTRTPKKKIEGEKLAIEMARMLVKILHVNEKSVVLENEGI